VNSNWKKGKIGDVLEVARGGSPRPIKKYLTDDPNGLNWIKISDATASDKYIFKTKQKITKDGLHKTRYVEEGDFLLSNSMSFGRPYIMKTDGCIHDGWLVLKKTDKVDLDTNFLYYLLSSQLIFDQFDSLAAGSTVRNLNISLVSSVEIPIPPLPEQKRIVEILDEAFEAIDQAMANIEKNIQNAEELFQSKLNDIFSQKGDGWEEKNLGEISKTAENIKWDSTKAEREYIDLSSVSRVSLKITETEKVNFKNAPSRAKKIVEEGDVIFGTTRPTLKRVAIIDEEYSNQICSTGFYVVRPNKKQITTEWVYLFLQTKSFMDRMEAIQSGASYPAVNYTDMKNTIIRYPTSTDVQNSLADQLFKLQHEVTILIKSYSQRLASLEELKKSILQKAFSGELTGCEPGFVGLQDEQDGLVGKTDEPRVEYEAS